jgi:nicotinamidase-related amidase
MKKALLLIDLQNDYFEGGKMALVEPEKAALKAQKVLQQFRAVNLLVVHIQHIALSPTATFFIPNTHGSEINEMVKPIANEKLIVKHYPNGFRETELQEFLQNNGVTDLTICGMMTHMCVDATTRAAKDWGYNCTLIGDACATKQLEFAGIKIPAEHVHYAFLAALKGTYADIIGL